MHFRSIRLKTVFSLSLKIILFNFLKPFYPLIKHLSPIAPTRMEGQSRFLFDSMRQKYKYFLLEK